MRNARKCTRTAFGFLVAAAGLITAAGRPAGATPPQDVAIATLASYVPGESFTWSASGAISDDGTFEFTSAHWGGVPSPAVGALRLGISFTGGYGTFDVETNLVVTATSTPGVYSFDGAWVITGGTGAYEDLRGTGRVHVSGRVDGQSTPADPEVGTFTGRVHAE